MRGSKVVRLRPCMARSTPPLSPLQNPEHPAPVPRSPRRTPPSQSSKRPVYYDSTSSYCSIIFCPHQQFFLLPVVLLRREWPILRVEVRQVVRRRVHALDISLLRNGERRGLGDRRRWPDLRISRRRPRRRLLPVLFVRGRRGVLRSASVATAGVRTAAAGRGAAALVGAIAVTTVLTV